MNRLLNEKYIFKRFKIREKRRKKLYDNITFIFTPTNHYKSNPNIVEDVFGKYQLKFSGNIKNYQYQNYQKKLFFLIYYQCFSKIILKKYSQEKF